MSGHPDGQRVLVGGHEHGFIAAVTAAFRDHYPLSLKPQHFWLMITQAVAVHVSNIIAKTSESSSDILITCILATQ